MRPTLVDFFPLLLPLLPLLLRVLLVLVLLLLLLLLSCPVVSYKFVLVVLVVLGQSLARSSRRFSLVLSLLIYGLWGPVYRFMHNL